MPIPTTLDTLKTELGTISGVVAVSSDPPKDTSYSSLDSINVRYLINDGGAVKEIIFTVLQKEDNTIYYYKNIPDILKDEPSEREFILTEQQLKNKLEADDLTIDILNIRLSRRGDMDQATVEYIKNELAYSDVYIIRQENVEPWEPWDNNNDNLYQVGDKVSHNGKYWVATTGDNHWEPDTVASTIWEEIDPSDLVHVNKRNITN